MSDKSNNQGRAYEYAWCLALEQKLSVFKKVIVDKQNKMVLMHAIELMKV
ncbi:haeIII restriction endonuclease family protein [Helicobacter pylori Hp P-3]|nr:haeIII restriction endonuclease family protein [Helicobacter pylori Hp P-3]EJC56982.1 haeIII restriction endonuclease family protein [Helicobacter pylori Hp P-3b]